MTAVSPISQLLFFYIFFIVLIIFLSYGLWQNHEAEMRAMPTPLAAAFLGMPDYINLFDTVDVVLQVKNCGTIHLKKIRVACNDIWTFSLKPGDTIDIPLKLDTSFVGRHQLSARIYCRHWELHLLCMYRVLQRKLSQREKYLKILGLKPGATAKEIRRARNRLAKRYHPDLGGSYEEKMKEINEAYHYLMDS